jgi:Arylsulfotransferase (ASST)
VKNSCDPFLIHSAASESGQPTRSAGKRTMTPPAKTEPVGVHCDGLSKGTAPDVPKKRWRLRLSRSFFSRVLFLLGVMSLGCVLGTADMFYELPGSGLLSKSFLGARAWLEETEIAVQRVDTGLPRITMGDTDEATKTFDGFTLCTFSSLTTPSTQALLINMHGDVVHRWAIPFSEVWPQPAHLSEPIPDNLVCFFGFHAYPNGDLLVVFHGLKHLVHGFGLAKLDRDSHVLWTYAGHVHHDVDVGEDGTIYAIQQELVNELPHGLEFITPPKLVDSLVMLSADGTLLQKPIPLLEAFRDSPYASLLASLDSRREPEVRGRSLRAFEEAARRRDALHTNFVQVLSRRLAPHFPQFKAGQVLISSRNLHAVAVVDPQSRSVVLATRGPWKAQHDSQFLASGHLLIFDNLGDPSGSRVLEYDPQTGAIPWSYGADRGTYFFSYDRGQSQRLGNGNTLIVNTQGGEIFEVTPSKNRVWSCTIGEYINLARRYSPQQLPFLKASPRPRPD